MQTPPGPGRPPSRGAPQPDLLMRIDAVLGRVCDRFSSTPERPDHRVIDRRGDRRQPEQQSQQAPPPVPTRIVLNTRDTAVTRLGQMCLKTAQGRVSEQPQPALEPQVRAHVGCHPVQLGPQDRGHGLLHSTRARRVQELVGPVDHRPGCLVEPVGPLREVVRVTAQRTELLPLPGVDHPWTGPQGLSRPLPGCASRRRRLLLVPASPRSRHPRNLSSHPSPLPHLARGQPSSGPLHCRRCP